jgi:hypothetical protein
MTFPKRLPSQKSHLLPKPSVRTIPHPSSLLADDGCVAKRPICASETISSMSLPANDLTTNYLAFVETTEARKPAVFLNSDRRLQRD